MRAFLAPWLASAIMAHGEELLLWLAQHLFSCCRTALLYTLGSGGAANSNALLPDTGEGSNPGLSVVILASSAGGPGSRAHWFIQTKAGRSLFPSGSLS